MKSISVGDLRKKLESRETLHIVDVRSPGEYAAGHIPGAVNVPLEEVPSRVDDLAVGDHLILTCQSGMRASTACQMLADRFPQAVVLDGGFASWQGSGCPSVQSTSSSWSIERQVRLAAGLLVFSGVVLSQLVAPGWIYLSGFVGLGLTFAGATNFCGMGILFAKAPWNRPRKVEIAAKTVQAGS